MASKKEKLKLLRKAVLAKLAWWDAMDELEDVMDMPDEAHDEAINRIDLMAAGLPASDKKARSVTKEHLDDLEELCRG